MIDHKQYQLELVHFNEAFLNRNYTLEFNCHKILALTQKLK